MNLPNKLTISRIILVPVFMGFATFSNNALCMLLAFIVFVAACLTDFFDGFLARKHNIVTSFGKFADPLADKLLTTTAFIYMMQLNACDPVVIIVILAREFAVSGIRMVVAGAPGGKVIAANIYGKIKTVLQMVTIILFYLLYYVELQFFQNTANSVYFSQFIGYVLCWVVAVFTAISGVIYIWQSKEFINTSK